MMNYFNNYNIILASQSPRRQELMRNMGFKIEVEKTDVEEVYPPELQREEIAVYLSEIKAQSLAHTLEDKDILLTADTIVWKDNQVLHKPKNREEAIEMIRNLSDDTHWVYTGVTLIHKNKKISFFDVSKVVFLPLSDNEIEFYVDTYKPYDKAGAYGVQEWIGYIGIKNIEGSYYNIMGLPTHLVYKHIKEIINKN